MAPCIGRPVLFPGSFSAFSAIVFGLVFLAAYFDSAWKEGFTLYLVAREGSTGQCVTLIFWPVHGPVACTPARG